jgi:hypothetical protein
MWVVRRRKNTLSLRWVMEMMISIYLWWLGRNISQVENREGVVGSELGEGDQ